MNIGVEMEIKSAITDPIAGGQPALGLRVPTSFIFLPEHTVEEPLEACRVCLLMDCRLYSMQQCNLKDMFKQLTGLRLPNDKYLSSVCAECATFLVKCKQFREKSLAVQNLLNVLSTSTHSVPIERIKQFRKQKKLSSNLSAKQSLNYYGPDIYVIEDYEEESQTNSVEQNPYNNLDTDIYVCEDEEDVTTINIINSKQINTELEIDCDESDTDYENAEVNVSKEISEVRQKVEFKEAGHRNKTITAQKSVVTQYNCEQCDKVLNSKSVYLEHLRLEHHSTQHVCCICGLSFLDRRSLTSHQSRSHMVDNSNIPDAGPRCPKCSLHFLSEEALQTHLQGNIEHSDSEFDEDLNAETSDSPENEEYLKSEFESDGEEKDNVKEDTAKGIQKSVLTRKRTPSKVPRIILNNMIVVKRMTLEEQLELIQKKRENNENKPFKCDTCHFGTNYNEILETHMKRHSKEMGEFSCNLCHVRFKTSRAYHRHNRRHTYVYSCVECPFTTHMHCLALRHVSQFHKRKKHTCGICGKVYINLNGYYEHKRIMHPSSQHVCSLCGYSFCSKYGVESHHRAKHLLESTEIPTPTDGPACAECSLRFMNENALQTHMRISHTTGTGEKMRNSRAEIDSKVVCETCGKLVNMYRLKYHLEEHAGKKYSCPICGHTCKNKIVLYQHKFYTHGKGKEYRKEGIYKKEERAQCTVCEKTLSTKACLKKHMARAHSSIADSVHCSYCDKQFMCAANLKQHVDHVHLKKPWNKKRAK